MALSLVTESGNFRAFKILIAAEYNGINIEIVESDNAAGKKIASQLHLPECSRIPVLQTQYGPIFESNAIARYIARIRRDTELCGDSLFDSGRVDSWIDFCTHEIDLPATLWYYPILGWCEFKEEVVCKARQDLLKSLTTLNHYLLDKTYLVGDRITLADITVASSLVYPFKFVLGPEHRSGFVNLVRWFNTCVNQPQFSAVVGEIVMCTHEMPAGSGSSCSSSASTAHADASLPTPPVAAGEVKKPKKEKAAKQPKPVAEGTAAGSDAVAHPPAGAAHSGAAAASSNEGKKAAKKPKDDDNDEDESDAIIKAESAKKNPLAVLDQTNPSAFDMDSWKRLYSNTHDFVACLAEFWTRFDAAGYSLWIGRYKYQSELTVDYRTSNLVSGFLQRSGDIRRWLFGVVQVTRMGGEFAVGGAWLIRGQDIGPLFEANPDAEHYTWTKIETPVSDADKAKVTEFWIAETVFEGHEIYECKVFK